MSLDLIDPVPVDDQALTPTPGSPRPYIPADNHDRLDSIQLSSDASGEFSITHSPRSFLAPPGEALSELCNALNPPWLHGLTGTPPTFVGLNRVEQASPWVEDALGKVERPSLEVASHVDLARLSLGDAAPSPPPPPPLMSRETSLVSSGQSRPMELLRTNSSSNTHSDVSLDLLAKTMSLQSPFDKSTNDPKSTVDARASRTVGSVSSKSTHVPKGHDARSGDGSSGEDEAWPMPETPFLTHDVWNHDVTRNRLVKEGQLALETAPKLTHSFLPTSEPDRPLSHPRKSLGGGGRAHGLTSQHRAKEGERRVGRCKMYNCDKGVGFLIDDRLDQVPYDVKIHWTDLYSDQEFKSLAKGEVVEYTLNITSNGYSASYVTGPGGRPVMGAEQTIVQASRQTSYKLFKAGALPVKTYRSKWDSIPATFAESPELPLPSTTINYFRTATTPRSLPNAARSSNLANSGSTSLGPPPKNIKVKLPSARPDNQAAEGLANTRLPPARESPSLASDHGQLTGPGRALDVQASLLQFSTPAWGSLRSSLNLIPTPSSLMSCGTSSHTPLLGLSHATLTPNSVEPYDPLFFGGYPSQPMSAMRSPAVQISTPAESSNTFFSNRLLNNSSSSLNQRDLQNFFAERQMLLQHQAALMSLYQNVNHHSAAMAMQTNHQLPPQNPGAKSRPSNFHPSQQYFAGLYERSNTGLDPQSQAFGLLPPIILPTGKLNLGSEVNLSTMSQARAPGIWRSPELSEPNLEPSASLRPGAQAFMPSTGELHSDRGISLLQSVRTEQVAVAHEVAKPSDGLVYQVPGRRSVSDPASNGAVAANKPSALSYSQTRPHKAHPINSTATSKHGVKLTNPKRVTFAEQATAARRIVSYGEVPSPQPSTDRSPPEGEDSEDDAELFQDSAEDIAGVPKPASAVHRNGVEPVTNEDGRRVGEVKSVEIAMERLREAAAPRRLSNVTHQVLKPLPHEAEATRLAGSSFSRNGTNPDIENPRRHSNSPSSEIPPDRFNLSSVIKESPSMLTQLQV